MRNWRIISTIAAVVFAAIAGVLVWKYLTSADTRAEKNKDLVTVLVAKSQIARGTVFDQALPSDLFETKQIPKRLAAARRASSRPPTPTCSKSTRARSPPATIFTGTAAGLRPVRRGLAARQHRFRRDPERVSRPSR